MKTFLVVALLLSTLTLATVMAQDGKSPMMLQPPNTEKKPKVTEINGDRLASLYGGSACVF